MWVIKRKLRFQGYKNCLEAAQTNNKPILKTQQRSENERHIEEFY